MYICASRVPCCSWVPGLKSWRWWVPSIVMHLISFSNSMICIGLGLWRMSFVVYRRLLRFFFPSFKRVAEEPSAPPSQVQNTSCFRLLIPTLYIKHWRNEMEIIVFLCYKGQAISSARPLLCTMHGSGDGQSHSRHMMKEQGRLLIPPEFVYLRAYALYRHSLQLWDSHTLFTLV